MWQSGEQGIHTRDLGTLGVKGMKQGRGQDGQRHLLAKQEGDITLTCIKETRHPSKPIQYSFIHHIHSVSVGPGKMTEMLVYFRIVTFPFIYNNAIQSGKSRIIGQITIKLNAISSKVWFKHLTMGENGHYLVFRLCISIHLYK